MFLVPSLLQASSRPRSGHGRLGQGRAGQGRAGQSRPGQARPDQGGQAREGILNLLYIRVEVKSIDRDFRAPHAS